MLRSLDPDQLLALLDKNERAGCCWIQIAKDRFRDRNLSEYALNLLTACPNELSRSYLNIHNHLCKNYEQGVDEWDIGFLVLHDHYFWRPHRLIHLPRRIDHLHI